MPAVALALGVLGTMTARIGSAGFTDHTASSTVPIRVAAAKRCGG